MNKIFIDLALIIVVAKVLGIFMRKLKLPEVIGSLLAGIILGPNITGLVTNSSLLDGLAKIGVALIMFSAGLETNIKQIKSAGFPSVIITALGVIVPLGGGFLIAGLFNGFNDTQILSNIFYGIILTATSVAITVATLKEIGHLNSKVGTSILSAAVLDDIIGLVILSIVLGQQDGTSSIGKTILFTFLFFISALVSGKIINYIFKRLESKYEHHRRMPILSIAICFFFAYAAEAWFGLAEIVGAFMAGVVFSDTKDANYIERRVDQSNYLLFAPIFFAHIGIYCQFQNFSTNLILFGLCWVVVGLAAKIIGCGLGAKICHYTNKESLRVGIGMMARAEVCLITTQKGISAGLIGEDFMPFVILLVILSSLITPLLLKSTFTKKDLHSSDTEIPLQYHLLYNEKNK